ncbi:MAG: glycosyltransferase family 39 protein [Flavipsychrobacter sp.]
MPKIPFWVFILVALLHLSAYRVDVMDIDASQYAEMSREMMESGDYLHTYDRGIDYLDKPPFLFWVSAASMKVFGVNNFGYKFPSILFALFAIFATYRLARLLYGDEVGRMAALVFGVCQGLFLMTNDIRTDTVLMSWVITAIWLIKEWEVHKKLHHLLLGCAAISFGMMSKGPVALMIPIFSFATDWALKRNWKMFFRWEYLLGLVVIAVLLIPMSIGLYQQFDMHPEKIVNEVKGPSGLRFFYWSQSFGRITGESPWNNGAGFDFLMLNMLWSFLPWIFLFIPALIINIVQLVKQKFKLQPNQEWITTGGFILGYLALGSSKYQLPHYIFVVFPLAAIMVAKLLADFFETDKYKKLYNVMRPVHYVIFALMLVFAFALITFVFPASMGMHVTYMFLLGIWLYIALSKVIRPKLFWLAVGAMIIVNIFGTHHFYTNLTKYQVGSSLSAFMNKNNIPPSKLVKYREEDPLNCLHFYLQHVINKGGDQVAPGKYVLTMEDGKNELKQKGFDFDVVLKEKYCKISELTIEFMNPATRDKATKDYYLLKIK